ncbi:glycosyltransferase [Candidatus Saccharibacteria bacterium]|nr:glycosyltransferase [Candidatus Saccharibacteria bacterium]
MAKASRNMQHSPLISIILPIYNVESYLSRCLDSVITQDYQNLEIILVNDGSTDNSLQICQEYQAKDPRIKLINQSNAGLSAARNKGISVAKGEFISFIDSDDYVESNYISHLYHLIEKDGSDFSAVKHNIIRGQHIEPACSHKIYLLSPHETLEMMLYDEDFNVSAWGKLYRKTLFKDIRFPEGMLFEDSATTYKLILAAKSISFDSIPLYNYIIRDNSITTRDFTLKNFDLITATQQMGLDILKVYPDLQKAVSRRVMYAHLSVLANLACSNQSSNHEYVSRLLDYIKTHRREILKDHRIPKRDRYALFLLKFGYRSFRFVWRRYNSKKSCYNKQV